MNLPFSTVLNGKKTHFIEKIWTGLIDHEIVKNTEVLRFIKQHTEKFGCDWDFVLGKPIPKIHTLRKVPAEFWHWDEPLRFRKGKNIHFVINNRSKNYFRFAPIIQVTGNQLISIDYNWDTLKLPKIKIYSIRDFNGTVGRVVREINPQNHFEYITWLDVFAKNDGFDSWEEFLKYFNEDGIYNIIHWTNFRY